MSAAHHGNDDLKRQMDETIRRFLDQGDGKASRAYPEGRMGAHDEGALSFAVSTDQRHRTVVLTFNKPVAWVGMGADDAVRLAELLVKHARNLGATVSLRL